MKRLVLFHIWLLGVCFTGIYAQGDTIPQVLDTVINAGVILATDSLITSDSSNNIANYEPTAGSFTIPISADTLDAAVEYSADDSIIYDIVNGKAYLYGNAKATYKDIKLDADFIIYDWYKNTLSAEMNTDSLGRPIGWVNFEQGGKPYRAHKMSYNFKTTKGKIYEARTQEGEGYLLAEAVKKNEYGEWYGYKGKFTTCNLDEPHFHIQSKRMKIVPDKVIVSGPANLVIAGIPTPLALPFGIFPAKQGKRSGLVPPEYGEEAAGRGFFLRNGGYYFGGSEYFDLLTTADFYSNGSWALRASTKYRKRYKYAGGVNLQFGRNRQGEPESPTFAISNDFKIAWQHSQDAKARPGTRFSADVNFGSTSFNRNVSTNQEDLIRGNLASRVSYGRSLGRNMNFSVNARHDQSLNTGRVNVQFPNITFNVGNITPLKPKVSRNKQRFYERLSIAYAFKTGYSVSGIDSTFFTLETLKEGRFGVEHNVPISMPMRVLKYFTVTPSITYNEKWYARTQERTWNNDTIVYTGFNDEGVPTDSTQGLLQIDRVNGFRAARTVNLSANITTILYGQINFKKGKLKAIRHVLTPTVGFTYTPDYGADFWNYYRTVQTDTAGTMEEYSVFNGTLYGGPGQGTRASINFNLNNNLQIKLFSRKDTVKNEKNVSLVDRFTISGNYNLAADSLKMSLIRMNYNTTFFDRITIQAGFNLDPYIVNNENRRINTTRWKAEKRFFRLASANFAVNVPLRPNTKSQPVRNLTAEERQVMYENPYAFYDFNIPWNINVRYNLNLTRGTSGAPDTLLVTANSFSVDLDVNLTPKWKVVVNSGYDITRKQVASTNLTVIRDLHCWEMRFNFRPFPRERQFYSMQVNVKSPILQDLKLSRKNDGRFADTAF